jgi:hypothetical protein
MNLKNLSEEKKEKLKEYIASIKEIKKAIKEIIKEAEELEEAGGNRSKELTLNV